MEQILPLLRVFGLRRGLNSADAPRASLAARRPPCTEWETVQVIVAGWAVQVFVAEQFVTRFAVLTGGVLFVYVVQYQHVQGHLVGLLQIIVATHVDLSIRQVASIYFKNVTARDWMPREPGKQGFFP